MTEDEAFTLVTNMHLIEKLVGDLLWIIHEL